MTYEDKQRQKEEEKKRERKNQMKARDDSTLYDNKLIK